MNCKQDADCDSQDEDLADALRVKGDIAEFVTLHHVVEVILFSSDFTCLVLCGALTDLRGVSCGKS